MVEWCAQYARDVKHAKDKKVRLSQEVTRLDLASQNASDLPNGPQGAKHKASKVLFLATINGKSQLRHLKQQLGQKVKTRSKASLDALKWPFQSKEVDMLIQDLRQCTEDVSSVLQIDQRSVLARSYL